MNNLEEQFYGIAAREVAERRFVPAIMAKAFSEADGDERKSVARYIKLRVNQLSAEYKADIARQETEAKILHTMKATARQQHENPPRMCCWSCAFFECTGWLDKTKGVCKKHQRKTLAYEVCESHEWKLP